MPSLVVSDPSCESQMTSDPVTSWLRKPGDPTKNRGSEPRVRPTRARPRAGRTPASLLRFLAWLFPPGKTGPLLVVVLLLPGLTGCLGPGQPAPDGTPTPPGGPQPVATGSPTVRGILAVGQPTPRANQGPWLIFEEKPDN